MRKLILEIRGTMITKLFYSVHNNEDGSTYPVLMESEELSKLDQTYSDGGWGENYSGYFTIESDGPIRIIDPVFTVHDVIAEVIEELEYAHEYNCCGETIKLLEDKLTALKELRDNETRN